jgi:hypothetical protein
MPNPLNLTINISVGGNAAEQIREIESSVRGLARAAAEGVRATRSSTQSEEGIIRKRLSSQASLNRQLNRERANQIAADQKTIRALIVANYKQEEKDRRDEARKKERDSKAEIARIRKAHSDMIARRREERYALMDTAMLLRSVASTAGLAGASLLAFFSIPAKAGIELNDTLRAAESALKRVMSATGDRSMSPRELIKRIQYQAVISPIETAALVEFAKQYTGAGAGRLKAADVPRELAILSDAAAVLAEQTGGGHTQLFKRLGRAYMVARSREAINQRVLNQLARAGIPVNELWRTETGKSAADLWYRAQRPGGVPTEQVMPVLSRGMERMFGGATLQALGKSSIALWEALKDTLVQIAGTLYGPLQYGLTSVLKLALSLSRAFEMLPPPLKTLASIIASLTALIGSLAGVITLAGAGILGLASMVTVGIAGLPEAIGVLSTLAPKSLLLRSLSARLGGGKLIEMLAGVKSKVPGLAAGGIHHGVSLVGEQGPELLIGNVVVPLNKVKGYATGGVIPPASSAEVAGEIKRWAEMISGERQWTPPPPWSSYHVPNVLPSGGAVPWASPPSGHSPFGGGYRGPSPSAKAVVDAIEASFSEAIKNNPISVGSIEPKARNSLRELFGTLLSSLKTLATTAIGRGFTPAVAIPTDQILEGLRSAVARIAGTAPGIIAARVLRGIGQAILRALIVLVRGMTWISMFVRPLALILGVGLGLLIARAIRGVGEFIQAHGGVIGAVKALGAGIWRTLKALGRGLVNALFIEPWNWFVDALSWATGVNNPWWKITPLGSNAPAPEGSEAGTSRQRNWYPTRAPGAWSPTGGYGGRMAPQHRAGGGPVKYGHPYVVGEKGPELFVPWASGIIHANPKPYDQMEGLLRPNSPAGALLTKLKNAIQALLRPRAGGIIHLYPNLPAGARLPVPTNNASQAIIHANPRPSTLWPRASGIIRANPRLYDQYVGLPYANPRPSTLWPRASGIIHANPRLYDQYVGLPYANSPAGSLLPVLSNIATQAIMSRRKLSTLDLWPRWYNYGSHGVRMNRDGKVGYLSASQEGDDLKIELVIVGAGGARNARRFYYDTAGKEMLRF